MYLLSSMAILSSYMFKFKKTTSSIAQTGHKEMMSVSRPFFPHVLFVRFGQAFAVKVQGQRSAHCLGFQGEKTHEINIQMVKLS